MKKFAHRVHPQRVALCESCLSRRPRRRILGSIIAMLLGAGGIYVVYGNNRQWDGAMETPMAIFLMVSIIVGAAGVINLIVGLAALYSKEQNVMEALDQLSLDWVVKDCCEVCGRTEVEIEILARHTGNWKQGPSGYRCAEHAKTLKLEPPYYSRAYQKPKAPKQTTAKS